MIIEFIHNNECDVVVSLVAPYKWLREEFKQKIGLDNFQEIYVHTTQIRGKEKYHTKDYEQPQTEFIDVDTTKDSPEKSFSKIINQLLISEKITK